MNVADVYWAKIVVKRVISELPIVVDCFYLGKLILKTIRYTLRVKFIFV